MSITDTFTPFDEDGGLIFATQLPGSQSDFTDQQRSWSDLQAATSGGPLWIHLNRRRDRAKDWLRNNSNVNPSIVESLLAEETRPQAHFVDNGALVILRGVNMNPGADPDELIVIRMWIEPNRIITLRQFRFQTIADLRQRAMNGEAPATSGAFLAAVAAGLSLRLGPTAENLESMIDAIEDEMLDGESDDPARRSDLATIRRQAISYRRYVVPQRDALLRLSLADSPLLSDRDRVELRVSSEHVARMSEALEEVRDRAAVTQDEMRARHEAKLSRTLYLLTIVATIALPLSILTGLLGINVGGIPLADSSLGFAVVCGIMLLVAAGEFLLFRYMKWL